MRDYDKEKDMIKDYLKDAIHFLKTNYDPGNEFYDEVEAIIKIIEQGNKSKIDQRH